MTQNPLHKIMSPSSISIVGASNNPMKMGTMQFLNIVHGGFKGKVMPIHPKEKIIFGIEAFANIKDLPVAPDLAMLVVPTHLIPSMMEEFGQIGTKHALIISAGFKEVGKEGEELEKQVISIARKYGIRFVGPNCMGLINTHLPLNTTVGPVQDLCGNVSIISQSGTYVAQVLSYIHNRGIRFSKAISVGNEADIDIVDCLEYLGEDTETKAIGIYIECIRRPEKFLEIARNVVKNKPVVAQYVGGNKAGAKSGLSHTGALAGPDYIYDGLFEQAGVIRVKTIEEIYSATHTLGSLPRLKGKRIAILTNSGGPATAMASVLDENGLEMPELSIDLQEKIKSLIPGHASSKNPVDLTFHMDMSLMTDTLPTMLLESDEIDGLLIHGIMDTGWAELAFPVFSAAIGLKKEDLIKLFTTNLNAILELPWKTNKPIIISSFFDKEDHAKCSFYEKGIPAFNAPEKAAKAMSMLYKYYLIQNKEISKIELSSIPERAIAIMNKEAINGIDEYTAKSILRTYNISTCKEILVKNPQNAVLASKTIGYPVVVKACSKEIKHKTEAKLVHINLKTDEEVFEACVKIQKIAKNSPLLICEMIKGEREFMAGIARVQGFPPCVMFGIGGIFAEVFCDRAIRIAPLSLSDAYSLIHSIKSHEILGNYRGMGAVDIYEMAKLLVALGNIAVHFPDIKEIDLNPIIIQNRKPIVVDSLFIK
ncbi:MAG: acetate--CoA ligase family protein [Desulfobacterales bacterium]|nr:acetate--CoA ligase family protein [Desulfobacterales bacterium]